MQINFKSYMFDSVVNLNIKILLLFYFSSSSFPSRISTPTKVANKTMNKPNIDFQTPKKAIGSGE